MIASAADGGPARGAIAFDAGVRFSVWAPHARSVSVRIARHGTHPLLAGSDGEFTATVAGVAPGADYVYLLTTEDGRTVERPDPASRHQPHGVHGPSRVVDPRTFSWTDQDWCGRPLAEYVLYELHVGTFTEGGTFEAVIPHLGRLAALGVTAIELMPVAEFPGGRNWGYDGVAPYAPQSTYGGPDGLRRLVDAAHRAALAIVLDVVYNHLGPEGNRLADFGPYFTDRYRTPWGQAMNFDGADSDDVRRFVVDNACYWVRDFHVDGLRLDAVHAILDQSARQVVHDVADAARAEGARAGRRVCVIAESDLNDPRLVRPPERGGCGLDGMWSDDFHHALHVALTGERTGYYADFDGVPSLANAFRDRQVYVGQRSRFRRRRHGAPAGDVPADRIVVFAQNHDQVGNRGRGERLTALVPADRVRVAAAVVLLSPYVPLLFMGDEYGESRPFLYFTSHGDAALAEAVRAGRRSEFAGFAWEDDVPDPQAEDTFARSRLDHGAASAPGHREIVRLHADLLAFRRSHRALSPGCARLAVTATSPTSFVVHLAVDGEPAVAAAYNLGDGEASIALPPSVRWRLALDTDAVAYGGAGRTRHAADVALPPWTAAALVGEPA